MTVRLNFEIPQSLASAVEQRIRDAIVNAELDFGQALPEDGMGLTMGVSRTPMREALTRLQLQGLVVIIPKRGTFVFNPSINDVENLAGFRLVLEKTGVSTCLTGKRRPMLDDMRAAFEAMAVARRGDDRRAYSQADSRFHESFFSHCGNPYLVSAYHSISWQVAALRAHLTAPRASEQDISFEEHRQMIECVENGRRAPLMRLLRQHIMRSTVVYGDALRGRLGEA